jgi:predicted ester cyclase
MVDGAGVESTPTRQERPVPAIVEGAAPNGAAPEPASTSPHRASAAETRVMPTDFSIALEIGNGAWKPGVERGPRRQSMRGFEPTYVDIVDYIVRVTHRIWEDQDVGYIYDTYAPACRVYDDGGPRHGVEPMVEGTLQRISAFPDMRHYADEVIWAGDDQQGFVTSHRALNIGYHTGHWRWGPPTGRKVNSWVIANCAIANNEIYEEYVLYNMAAQLAQLGVNVAAAARAHGNAGLLVPLAERDFSEVERLKGGQKPSPYPPADRPGFDVEHFVRALFHDTYNRRDLSAIDRAYAQNVRWYGTSNRSGYGRADVRAMARGLLATFPDLGLHVDDVFWMGNNEAGYRISVRWTARGTHRGWSLYQEPTGRRIHLWGLQQLYVRRGRIVEDWMLFNEFDILAQILKDDPAPLLA